MANKALREKSHCVVCWSNKSRFSKQKENWQLMLHVEKTVVSSNVQKQNEDSLRQL